MPKTGRKLGPEHEDEKLLNDEMKVTIEEAVEKAIAPPPPEEEVSKYYEEEEEEVVVKVFLKLCTN